MIWHQEEQDGVELSLLNNTHHNKVSSSHSLHLQGSYKVMSHCSFGPYRGIHSLYLKWFKLWRTRLNKTANV